MQDCVYNIKQTILSFPKKTNLFKRKINCNKKGVQYYMLTLFQTLKNQITEYQINFIIKPEIIMNVNQKFKVKQFQWFEMQTKVRQMIQDLISPLQKRILQNSSSILKMKQSQNQEVSKVEQLTMMITNDPKIFQTGIFLQVQQKFQIKQKQIQQIKRQIQSENNYVQQKFKILDARMKQSNEVIHNFSSLRERINKQIQIQNQNIDQIRLNLQKLIQETNAQLTKTNEKIVNNLMICEKQDNNLAQKIRLIQIKQQSIDDRIQNLKQELKNKSLTLQKQDERLQRIQKNVEELKLGQHLTSKLEQYVKDIQIAMRKAQFRIQTISPLVTQAQISEALQYILPQKMRKKVLVFGYRKYNQLNKEVLEKDYDKVNQKFNGMELIQKMQKKNTRQITQLKRKKIISMGIDIDHLTFQARQRYYQEVDMDQLSHEQQDAQTNAKIDQAQILNLVSLYFNQFTTDVSQKVKNQLQDTKAYLYGMENQIKKLLEVSQTKFLDLQTHCNTFHRDQMLQMKSVFHQLKSIDLHQSQLLNLLQSKKQLERKFYNFCSLINHLQIQDQIDKQNISLMGIQQRRDSMERQLNKDKNSIIQLQKNCYSCCGFPASVLSSFKMACLAYHPSSISIDSKQYKRQQLLQFTTGILQTIKANLQMNEDDLQIPIERKCQSTFQTLQKIYQTSQKQKRGNSTSGGVISKFTINDQEKRSSIRLRKTRRRTNQVSTADKNNRTHSLKNNSFSKEMINVSNAFTQLNKKNKKFLN